MAISGWPVGAPFRPFSRLERPFTGFGVARTRFVQKLVSTDGANQDMQTNHIGDDGARERQVLTRIVGQQALALMKPQQQEQPRLAGSTGELRIWVDGREYSLQWRPVVTDS